jgi:hypothetical protein
MAELIGRKTEIEKLKTCYESDKAEFVIVSGRRRIGKTFLVNSLYSKEYDFYYTGGHNLNNEEQLKEFAQSLKDFSKSALDIELKDWFEAFRQLKKYLESVSGKKKKVIFFDEMPWIDNHNSKFVNALEYFWNSWGAQQEDLLFIASGSATSWLNDKLIENQGGLHNRVTCRLFLEPFTLKETEEFLESKQIFWDRYQILQTYMILGGVPFYLNLLDKKYSLAQNIDNLFFAASGMLKTEFNELYSALFTNSDKYIGLVRALSEKKSGLLRKEIIEKTSIQGSTLTKMLNNLEKCGFIIVYSQFNKPVKDAIYKLSDFYTLFYFKFIENNDFKDINFWSHNLNSPSINSWQGFTFELVCLTHLAQIKKALGISGIATKSSIWNRDGIQIDLIIERADRIINLCEIKFSIEKYSITKDYADILRERMSLFREAVRTRKTLVNTFITTYGVLQGKHSAICQSEITADSLFED